MPVEMQAPRRAAWSGWRDEPVVILCALPLILFLARHHGSAQAFRSMFGRTAEPWLWAPVAPYLYWWTCAVFAYALVPMLIAKATGGAWTEKYGLGIGDWRAGLKWAAILLAVMLPIVVIASRFPEFTKQYPLAGRAAYTVRNAGVE